MPLSNSKVVNDDGDDTLPDMDFDFGSLPFDIDIEVDLNLGLDSFLAPSDASIRDSESTSVVRVRSSSESAYWSDASPPESPYSELSHGSRSQSPFRVANNIPIIGYPLASMNQSNSITFDDLSDDDSPTHRDIILPNILLESEAGRLNNDDNLQHQAITLPSSSDIPVAGYLNGDDILQSIMNDLLGSRTEGFELSDMVGNDTFAIDDEEGTEEEVIRPVNGRTRALIKLDHCYAMNTESEDEDEDESISEPDSPPFIPALPRRGARSTKRKSRKYHDEIDSPSKRRRYSIDSEIPKTPERRKEHNRKERERRQKMKNSLKALCMEVYPSNPNASQVAILDQALKMIKAGAKENAARLKEIDELTKENNRRNKRVSKLQKEVKRKYGFIPRCRLW